VGPGAGLNVVQKKRNPCPCRESNPGRPARSLVIVLTEISWFVCPTDADQNEIRPAFSVDLK